MAQKLPRLFRPRFSPRDFEKKLLKNLHTNEARALVDKLYKKDADGSYVLQEPYSTVPLKLDKKHLKEISTLAKEIGASAGGWIDFTKLGLVAAVGVGAVVFYTFFLDRIINNLAVEALQSVFQAKVEVAGMNLHLWEGKVLFDGLTVADKDQPMQNLFQLEKGEVQVDMAAAFSGSVVLRKLTAREMLFGTPRSTSGALPKQAPPPQDSGDQETAPAANPLDGLKFSPEDLPFGRLSNLLTQDPAALVAQQASQLQTVQKATEAAAALGQKAESWKAKGTETQKQLTTLGQDVRTLSSRSVSSIRTLPELQTLLTQINGASGKVQSLNDTVRTSVAALRTDAQEVQQLQEGIKAAVDADWNQLRSQVSLPEGGVMSWVGSLALPEIRRQFGTKVDLALQVYQVLLAVKATGEKKPVTITPQRQGQDIPFPSPRYPRFLLESVEISLGTPESGDFTEFRLSNVTTQPDLVASPAALNFLRIENGRRWEGSLLLDLRTGAEVPVKATAAALGLPLEAGDALQSAGISNFTGTSAWKVGLETAAKGAVVLTVDGQIARPQLSWDKPGEITGLIDRILRRADPLTVALKLDTTQGLSATTNLDRPAREEIDAWGRKKLAEFEKQLRKELDARTAAALGDNRTALASFTQAQDLVRRNGTTLEGYKRDLDAKKAEVEKRIRTFAGDQLRALPSLPALPTR